MVLGLLFTYVDIVTDVLVAIQYMQTPGQEGWATWTFLSLGLSLVVQAIYAMLLQPGQRGAAVYGLLGIKPIIETWLVVTGADTQPGARFSPEVLLGLSRLVEVLVESLPQAALQCFLIWQTDTPTTLQLVSLVGSCAATGYIFAMTDYVRRTSPSTFCPLFEPHVTKPHFLGGVDLSTTGPRPLAQVQADGPVGLWHLPHIPAPQEPRAPHGRDVPRRRFVHFRAQRGPRRRGRRGPLGDRVGAVAPRAVARARVVRGRVPRVQPGAVARGGLVAARI